MKQRFSLLLRDQSSITAVLFKKLLKRTINSLIYYKQHPKFQILQLISKAGFKKLS